MWINVTVLFLSALLAGLAVFLTPNVKDVNFKLALVFAGSYLFSITIIHIIPELFYDSFNPSLIGLFLLGGFFLQFFLEMMTSGVEHGHMHKLPSESHAHDFSAFFLLVGLSLHSIMEGALLAHPSKLHENEFPSGLLLGIILHKMPAAFALMSILLIHIKSKSKAVIYLVVFASASPIGLLFSDYLSSSEVITSNVSSIIFAIVSGNFLKISTTILFETDPSHRFNLNKMIVSALGALAAIGVEFVH